MGMVYRQAEELESQRQFQIEEREHKLREKQAHLEARLKEVEEMQANLRLAEKRLALRSKELQRMEDDVSSRRRGELRRQLGLAAGELLKYSEQHSCLADLWA